MKNNEIKFKAKIINTGEIIQITALDLLHQHVLKVNNIVNNTGIQSTMESIIKNCVKVQVRIERSTSLIRWLVHLIVFVLI